MEIPTNNKDFRFRQGYVPINAKALNNAIGKYYRFYLNYLIRTGVFDEGNGQYICGLQSRMFRYTKEYRQGCKLVEIINTFNFKFKKDLLEQDKKRLSQMEDKIGTHLKKFFKSGLLELDMEAVEAYLYNTFLKNRVRLRQDSFWNAKLRVAQVSSVNKADPVAKEKLTNRERTILKYYTILFAAQKIANNNYYHEFDPVAGRFHTSLTNLKKQLRNFLTYNGKSLWEIDVRNSQPYFSLVLLDKEFYGAKDPDRGGNFSYGHSLSIQKYIFTKDFSSNTLVNSLKTKDKITFNEMSSKNILTNNLFQNIPNVFTNVMVGNIIKEFDNEDIVHYKREVLAGTLYEYLLKKYIEQTGRQDMSRDKMKKVMFTILFSENEKEDAGWLSFKGKKIKEQRKLAKDLFRSCFPTVMKIFEYIKQDKHNLLACLLQVIEAHVMLTKVCGRIKRERPAMPLFTVHDSIMTPEGNEGYLKKIIEEECLKLTGNIPMLEGKLLHPDNLKPAHRLVA